MTASSYHGGGHYGDELGWFTSHKYRQKVIKVALRLLRKREKEFDAIAVRGVSGLVVGPLLAHTLKKHLIVVRKPSEKADSHADQLIEGPTTDTQIRYLIVDDFISNGSTVRKIVEEIAKLDGGKHVYVDTYMWRTAADRWWDAWASKSRVWAHEMALEISGRKEDQEDIYKGYKTGISNTINVPLSNYLKKIREETWA